MAHRFRLVMSSYTKCDMLVCPVCFQLINVDQSIISGNDGKTYHRDCFYCREIPEKKHAERKVKPRKKIHSPSGLSMLLFFQETMTELESKMEDDWVLV